MRSSPTGPPEQEVLAFSADQVRKLTGLTVRQLRYWDHTEFFSPEHAPGYRSGAFTRIYSFRDVVGLSAIATLRNEHQFPLQKLRLVGAYLKRFHDTPWASLALYVSGREILFREPGRPEPYTSISSPGQVVLATIELQEGCAERAIEGRAAATTPGRSGRTGRAAAAGRQEPARSRWDSGAYFSDLEPSRRQLHGRADPPRIPATPAPRCHRGPRVRATLQEQEGRIAGQPRGRYPTPDRRERPRIGDGVFSGAGAFGPARARAALERNT